MSEELTYGQKLIAEAIEHHFGERPASDDEYEDAEDTTLRDVWAAFDSAWNRRVPSPGVREAVEALTLMRDRLLQNGEWDDGCFYYHGTSASELQEPLALADAALRSLTGSKRKGA